MVNALYTHINKFITVTPEEFEKMVPYFEQREFKKKMNLLEKGKVCRSNYFVVKGCLRMFFINEKGTEQTIQFAMEDWWLADYTSFSKQTASGFFIQAVEKTTVLAITYARQEKLLAKFPQMERYFRLLHQRAHAASQSRIMGLYALSREEAYYRFAKLYPEFVNRVPQYLLASFLGFTPEYLSEIRGKKRS